MSYRLRRNSDGATGPGSNTGARPRPGAGQSPCSPGSSGRPTIARMEIASSVENREPVGIAASFPATQEKVFLFLEFKDVKAETSVNVV